MRKEKIFLILALFVTPKKLLHVFHLLLVIIPSYYLIGCSPYTRVTPSYRTIKYDKSHFKNTIIVKDDEFEAGVEISTMKGYSAERSQATRWWTDVFLRGYIDKTTGEKSYQVYVFLVHRKGLWRHPYQVNYGFPRKTSKTMATVSDVDCSGSQFWGCAMYENFGFMVDEKELRFIQNSSSQSMEAFEFQVNCEVGEDFIESISKTEIDAFLEFMDDYEFIKMR